MSKGGQATLGDSFGGDEEPDRPTRSQDPERTPTRSPTPEESTEVREDPEEDAPDEATQETVEEDEDDYLPGPEDMDPSRADPDDLDDARDETTTPGRRKRPATEWECPSCGEMSDKCYRCSECGKDLVT